MRENRLYKSRNRAEWLAASVKGMQANYHNGTHKRGEGNKLIFIAQFIFESFVGHLINLLISCLYYLEKGVGLTRVKLLVCPHKRYKIFCVAQVDYVMRISREHMYRLDLLAAYLKA